jgi:hypothetical protein
VNSPSASVAFGLLRNLKERHEVVTATLPKRKWRRLLFHRARQSRNPTPSRRPLTSRRTRTWRASRS